MKCFIILPNQLFEAKYLKKFKDSKIILIEEPLFFGDKRRIKNFSKLKLVLHRASMKFYFDYLKSKDFKVDYVDYKKVKKYSFIKKYDCVEMFEPVDHLFKSTFIKSLGKNEPIFYDTPLFLLSNNDLDEYNKIKGKSKTFFHKHFYDWQLKKLKIPYISKSYDEMNRKKIPNNFKIPKAIVSKNDNKTKYVQEAKNTLMIILKITMEMSKILIFQ